MRRELSREPTENEIFAADIEGRLAAGSYETTGLQPVNPYYHAALREAWEYGCKRGIEARFYG